MLSSVKSISNLSQHFNRLRENLSAVQRAIGKRDTLVETLKQAQQVETSTLVALENTSNAKLLLELFIKSTESQIKEYIEPTVTEALNFIFGQQLYFHIVFVSRRGQVETDFIIISTDAVEAQYQLYLTDTEKYKKELEELVDDYKDLNFLYGGAIQEVLGLVLRLLLIELLNIQGPVFLDEPTSAVHEEYASKVGLFIKALSNRFDRQVIYVTHSQALAAAADRCYEVKKIDNISVVEEER